MHWKTSLTIHD